MCSRFCTNTVDSLPQYTITNTTTNDVLISSLRTEHTNVLTETTMVPESDITDKAELYTTTEINKIIVSSAGPIKMFKGDDSHFSNNFTYDKNVTTVEPIFVDGVTTIGPSTKIFDEYTTNNILTFSKKQQNNGGETITTISYASTANINNDNELTTDTSQPVTSEDVFQMSTIPNVKNNKDNVDENASSFTTTEPSIKIFKEYTANNILSTLPNEQQEIDISSTVSNLSVNLTTDKIDENIATTNTFESVTSKDVFQINATTNLISNSNDYVEENSTRLSEPKLVEVTTFYDGNSETIIFNDGTENTLTSTVTNSGTFETENTVDSQDLNISNSTHLQDLFETSTFNGVENETKYFDDNSNNNLSSTNIILGDNTGITNIGTESATKPQNIKNIQTTTLPENEEKSTTTIRAFNEFSSTLTTDESTHLNTNNDSIDYIDTSTQSVNRFDSVETTTLNNVVNRTQVLDNNINTPHTSTVMIYNDNIQTTTDKSILFNKNEYTESSTETKTFEETIFNTTPTNLESTPNDFKSNTVRVINKIQEVTVTTDNLNEPMNSRTIYPDEENEIKNNVPSTTKSYSEITKIHGPNTIESITTENLSFQTFDTTTVRIGLNEEIEKKNASSFLETTTNDEFSMFVSTTTDQELSVISNGPVRSETQFDQDEETTKISNFLTTTSFNLNVNTDRGNGNNQTYGIINPVENGAILPETTTDFVYKEKEYNYTTTSSPSSITTVTEAQTSTIGTINDGGSTFIPKINGIGNTTPTRYDDVEMTTVYTTMYSKNVENNDSEETTLRPATNTNTESITFSNTIVEKTTVNSVISNQSTEKNTKQSITSDNIEAITVTAPNQVTDYFANEPFNSTRTDDVETTVSESTTEDVAPYTVPGSFSLNDSNVSQNTKEKWNLLFDTGSTNLSSTDAPPLVVGTRFTTINGMEETITNIEPTEAIVSKEIFTGIYEVTDGTTNNAANGIEYDLTTTTARTRGKNESVVTSTGVADRDDTISENEISTMANEVTTGLYFERKNESIVSTQIQGDQTDKIVAGGDTTTEKIITLNSVNSFETTTNIPMVTESTPFTIFTTTDMDVKYVNRDNQETTTVKIMTMADWIKTKNTTPKELSNEIVTENNFESSTEFNIRKHDDYVTTDISLEPLEKTNGENQIDDSSSVPFNDATTEINLVTTSIEVLVSSLSTENDNLTTTEYTITTDVSTAKSTENFKSTTFETTNKNNLDTITNPNEIVSYVTTIKNKINTIEFHDSTEPFTALPTEETTLNPQTDFPYIVDLKNESISHGTEPDTTDLNNMLTTTEYTITSKSIGIEDATETPADHNQTNINNSNYVQQITAATRKWCWNDTDCDAGHKCLAAKCLPTGESRVNNCPPGIITLQCLKGIIYT